MGRPKRTIAARFDPGAAPARHRFQVGPGAKDSARAGEHRYRQTPVALKRPEDCRQLARCRPVDRVTNLGTVDCDSQDRAPDPGAQRHHGDRTGPARRFQALLLYCFDLELDGDIVTHDPAAALEGRVPGQPEVLPADFGDSFEAGPGAAERVLRAGKLELQGDRAGHVADREVAVNLVVLASGTDGGRLE